MALFAKFFLSKKTFFLYKSIERGCFSRFFIGVQHKLIIERERERERESHSAK